MTDPAERQAETTNEESTGYHGAFQFRVFIASEYSGLDPQVNQSFIRISGPVTSSETIDYMRGTDVSVGTAPGRTRFDDVRMERIFNGTDDFYQWRRRIERGKMETGTVTIEMLDRNETVVRRIVCGNAWPKRWEMPDMDATSAQVAIEKITLVVGALYEDDV